MAKCPFCGSESIKIDTPFIDRVTGEKQKSFCCSASKKNANYVKRHYDPSRSDIPSEDEVAKW